MDIFIEPPAGRGAGSGPDLLSQTYDRYLDELERRTAEAERILGSTYRTSARYLEPLWKDAYKRLQEARDSGLYDDDYLSGLIWHEQRLAGMLHEAEQLYTAMLQPYASQLEASMKDASQLAEQSFITGVLRQAGYQGLPLAVFNRLPAAQLLNMTAYLADGSPIMSVMGRYGAEAPALFRRVLLEGMTNGESPTQVAKRVADALGAEYGRINVLTRTEMFRVYRGTLMDTYKVNRHLVKGWRWKAALQTRTCPVCWAMHGTIHDLDEPFASHPMCRCNAVPVLRPWSEIDPMLKNVRNRPLGPTGVQLFDRLPEGDKVTILGPTGARAYREGKLKLPQLVEETYSPIWGRGRAQRSLTSVLGRDEVRKLRGPAGGRGGRALPKAVPPPPVRKTRQPITPAPKPRGRAAAAKPKVEPPAPTPQSWQPSMTREEANRWAMQGDLTRPLYHVTSPEGAAGIGREGFDLTRTQWGRVWGNGAYMSDSSASERMYSRAFSKPTKIELRVFSRKTLRIDLSGAGSPNHQAIIDAIGPGGQDTYNRLYNEIRGRNTAFLRELDRATPEYISGDTWSKLTPAQRGVILDKRDTLTQQAKKDGRYVSDPMAETLTQTLQHHGYDALDLIDEPHRNSVGGSQVIVFDPQRVVVVKDPAP